MTEKYKNYIVPLWISSRVYECRVDGEEVCRTYILNSKTHEYLSFDDNAAKLWSFLLDSDYNGLIKYAKENDLYDELDLFFEELKKENLLEYKTSNSETNYEPIIYNDKGSWAENEFSENMSSWILSHGFLSGLFIELTYRCNLKCLHCFNDKEKQEKEITFEEIKPVIDDAIKLGVFSITLSGGECTIAKDFIKIAKYIREKRVSLHIFTNGQFLYDNPTVLDELLSLYPTKIHLSLYSMDEKVHDKITGVKGAHKKTIDVLKKLSAENVSVGIKCFITTYNTDVIQEINNFAKKIRASVGFDMKLLLAKDKNNKPLSITEEEMFEIYDKNFEILFKNKKLSNVSSKVDLNSIICKGGHYSLCVDPSLDVYPCVSLKIKFGSLKESSLFEIYKGKRKEPKYNDFLNIQKKNLIECYKEEYCGYCSYCMGIASSENRLFGKSQTCCKQAKVKWELSKIKLKV